MSYHTRPIPTTSQGVPGSIRYGIDHGRCYDVEGIYKYGQMVTDADSHFEAAQIALYKGPLYSVWVPNGTLLTVWRVGPKYDYVRSEKKEYRVYDGEPFPSDAVLVEAQSYAVGAVAREVAHA